MTKQTTNGPTLVEQAHHWRREDLQAIGAAISLNDWHKCERAYNQLRDKMDAAGCWDEPTPPSTYTATGAMQDGWRPIDDSSKDGREVDLWTTDRERTTDATWNAKRNRWEHWGMDWCENRAMVEVQPAATHYREVPDPPATGETP